jgi:hypothetical protein
MNESGKQLLRNLYPLYRPALSALGRLDDMARIYRTDKSAHGYTAHYQNHFRHLRRKRIKLLEIGVGDGGAASLKTWRDYFPKAEVYAFDIRDKTSLSGPRMHISQGDQGDSAFMTSYAEKNGPFDIVIDDGSHVSEHIITSYRALFPHVKDGGIYVIEDLFFSYDENNGGSPDDLNSPRAALGFLKTLVDDMHFRYVPKHAENYGDRIVGISFYPKICFIQKGDNTRKDDGVDAWYKAHPRETLSRVTF